MRVTLLTVGSRGDVDPVVAFGAGLARAGYDVGVATYGHYADDVRAHGLRHELLPGDPVRRMRAASTTQLVGARTNPLLYGRGLRLQAAEVRVGAHRLLDAALELCRGSDVLVSWSAAAFAPTIAEALGTRLLIAVPTPMTATRAFPSFLSPIASSRSRSYNRISHSVARSVLWRPFSAILNDWRRDRAGLPPLPWDGPMGRAHRARVPLYNAFSPAAVPPPADWGAWVQTTGFWDLRAPDEASLPPHIEAFLDSGRPPVCVDLGSLAATQDAGAVDTIVAGVRAAGERVVVLRGWGDAGETSDDDVLVCDPVAHPLLLPRLQALVHAAGAGTAGAVLRAGTPSVVVPLLGDQWFWARRCAALGVAPPPLKIADATVSVVRDAVRWIATDGAFRDRAVELARRIASEDGVARAVYCFRGDFGEPRTRPAAR